MNKQIKVRISATIDHDYEVRYPEHLPLDKLSAGVCVLTRQEAQAVLDDAEFNSDLTAQDVGPYAMPLGVFNAYKALAKQLRAALAA